MTSIFYTPHPDDETIGMAGHIARAVAAGHRTIIVQLFDALPSDRQQRLFGGRMTCPWHGEVHESGTDLLAARFFEQQMAAAVLGAELVTLGIQEPTADSEHYQAVHEQLLDATEDFARRYPDAVHHFVAGDEDVHATHTGPRLSHHACAEAGRSLAGGGARVLFHRVYIYSHPEGRREAGRVAFLSPAELAAKRAAIAAYSRWVPDQGRLAYGYHSVPELFDGAAGDAHEYLDLESPCPA